MNNTLPFAMVDVENGLTTRATLKPDNNKHQ